MLIRLNFRFRGSSPHTWGTHRCRFGDPTIHRFIPTYVGNTRSHSLSSELQSVHPHIRGEHIAGNDLLGSCGGSSPHTWGTPSRNTRSLINRRFIPTYVGNTPCSIKSSARSTVHPHIRGEHFFFALHCRDINGSSPHTWGTRSKCRP